ncbi:uncharacterized protein STEHIDRAFT_49350, partial [Stereum hirsutum FP-91666 SS1]|uniref:uncharacterized protein n=1 Tax=Stereum hirsutum (strain FP-91666) TaxID=721885 RepID=UPI000440DD62
FITFDPSITSDDSLAHGFRVFTNPNSHCRDPALRRQGRVLQDEAVTAYTDGSCLNNGDSDARAGSGVFFGPEDVRNISARLPANGAANNTGEIVAPLLLLQGVPDFAPVDFITDSKLVVDGLDERHREWEEKGFIGTPNEKEWRGLLGKLRSRGAPT